MRDIFELLKHEGHNIKIVYHEGQYVLGCKSCGKTLLTEKCLKENTNECLNVFTTLKNEDSLLLKYVKVFLDKSLSFDENLERCVKNAILQQLEELENKEGLNKIEKSCLDLDIRDLLRSVFNKYRDIKRYESLISSVFTKEEAKLHYLNAKNRVIEHLNKSLNGYSIYNSNDSVTFACKTFKYNDGAFKEDLFFIINDKMAKELEEENPTPTSVYTFENLADFYAKRPDWDDEEQGSNRFNEFMYRTKNDLYDFSNIEGGETILLKEAINVLGDFDDCERYVVPARKYLEKYL